jgi:LCP family protein required for cell wall assembly
MDKDDVKSTFDIDNDEEFNENFYKNIEMAFGEANVETPNTTGEMACTPEEEQAVTREASEITASLEESTKGSSVYEKSPKVEDKPGDLANFSEKAVSYHEISEYDIEEELNGINEALARQICDELEQSRSKDKQKEQKKQRFMRIRSGIALAMLCLVGFVFFFGFTDPGNQLLLKMGLNLSGTIWSTWTGNFEENVEAVEDVDYLDEEDIASDAEEIDPNTIIWPDHPGDGKHVEGVYNILLLGEEAIGSGDGRGRTDVIVIATMNTNTNKLMLTSLMRDTLVQIPGYKDNKLNTAYERGGLDLMYETIALNFDIQLDGCVKVNFENFEKIIDKLGGLELTLTAGEARYLNSTNYISKPQYRNVFEGKQLMNGNQVLGYSRVRKRATITGNNNDYGRTDRHRIVLNAIFDKYKTKSKVELASMMLNVLPMITTDIDSKNFELLLNNFIEMGTMDMSQLRIPADGTFTDNVKVRGMDVLIPDLQENAKILHDFVFGEEIKSGTTEAGAVTEETKPVTTTDTSSGN